MADRDHVIADAIDVMLTGLDAGSEAAVALGVSELSRDIQGHGRARLAISDADWRRSRPEMPSDLFVLQRFSRVAGDGNRIRTFSLGMVTMPA